jgi:hypothetical protein
MMSFAEKNTNKFRDISVCCLLICFGIILLYASYSPEDLEAGLSRITPETVVVGTIDPGVKHSFSVPINNSTHWKVSSLQATVSCGCTQATFSQVTLCPGGKANLDLVVQAGSSRLNRNIPLIVSYEMGGKHMNEILQIIAMD